MDISDRIDIIEVLNLYGFALDSRQWDLFDLVFAEDVIASFVSGDAVWSGRQEVKRSFAEYHESLDSHTHVISGQLVTIDGDGANAFSYGSWLLVREGADGGPTWRGTGCYDDRL